MSGYENLYLLRGNHEDKEMNEIYGFLGEMEDRFPTYSKIYDTIEEIFYHLPLAAVINGGIFCCHGGIGMKNKRNRNLKKLANLKNSKKKNDIIKGLLWSDPDDHIEGLLESDRNIFEGVFVFGENITDEFLESNGLNSIIRSHESDKVSETESYAFNHNGKILTIFSTPNYCGSNNLGSVLTIFGDCDEIELESGKCEVWEMV